MVGAVRILASGENPSREFMVKGPTKSYNHVFFAENRASRTWDLDTRTNETGSANWVTVMDNVNSSHRKDDELAVDTILRINPSSAGMTLYIAGRRNHPDIVFGPDIAVSTARSLAVGVGATETYSRLASDFRLPRQSRLADGQPQYTWSAASANESAATVTVDPVTGLLSIVGVATGSATISLIVHDSDLMTTSKNLSVTVS